MQLVVVQTDPNDCGRDAKLLGSEVRAWGQRLVGIKEDAGKGHYA